jgi:hypothetical protein
MARCSGVLALLLCCATCAAAAHAHGAPRGAAPKTPMPPPPLPPLPHGGSGVLAEVLQVTQRQLSSTLGGMLSVTVASLLIWVQTKVAARAWRAASAALFTTVEVKDPILCAALERWAALHAARRARRAGKYVAPKSVPSALVLERAKGAVAAAGEAPARLGSMLVLPVAGDRAGARSDPASYAIFEHAPPGEKGVAPPTRAWLSARVWLSGCPVWLHSSLDGGAPPGGGALLSGAPEPLLRLLDSSGLRALLAPAPGGTHNSGGGDEATSDDEGGGEEARVCVSVLRWHGAAVLRAALQAAYAHARAEERGTLTVRSVRFRPSNDGAKHPTAAAYEKLFGRAPRCALLSWVQHDAVLARGMRTVVLPAAALEVRAAAWRFMSPQYRAFCRAKGIPHRAGYALYGPAVRSAAQRRAAAACARARIIWHSTCAIYHCARNDAHCLACCHRAGLRQDVVRVRACG